VGWVGGHVRWSVWVPANRKMAGIGIDDAVDDALAYLKVVTEGAIDESRLRTFVVEANRMVETFEADSHLRFEARAEYPTTTPYPSCPATSARSRVSSRTPPGECSTTPAGSSLASTPPATSRRR